MASERLHVGCPVVIQGLLQRPENNGKEGTVRDFVEETQKYKINVCGRLLNCRRENLEIVITKSAPEAVPESTPAESDLGQFGRKRSRSLSRRKGKSRSRSRNVSQRQRESSARVELDDLGAAACSGPVKDAIGSSRSSDVRVLDGQSGSDQQEEIGETAAALLAPAAKGGCEGTLMAEAPPARRSRSRSRSRRRPQQPPMGVEVPASIRPAEISPVASTVVAASGRGGFVAGKGEGAGRGKGGGKGGLPRSVQLSKAMTRVLRHSAARQGLSIGSDGYCPVEQLLALREFKELSCSLADVQDAVFSSDKKRFQLLERQGVLLVRAVQGHSMKSVSDEGLLQPVTLGDPDVPSFVVHGTYKPCLESIKRQGLIAGGGHTARNHVHFSPFEIGDGRVISGMRANCQIAIYLDLRAALAEGVPFYRSANEVILSPGLQGVVPAKYIIKIKDLQEGRWLMGGS